MNKMPTPSEDKSRIQGEVGMVRQGDREMGGGKGAWRQTVAHLYSPSAATLSSSISPCDEESASAAALK
jgi:hypothetical protein